MDDFDEQLRQALEESARMHQQEHKDLCITSTFTRRRSIVRFVEDPNFPHDLYYSSHISDSSACTLTQVGVINQFHESWNALIKKYNTASAICGYMSLGFANIIANMPKNEFDALGIEELKDLLSDPSIVQPSVENAMRFVQMDRDNYINTNSLQKKTAEHYLKNWVANYEISDYCRALDPLVSKHIIFVRFNQFIDIREATFEERVRLLEEESFGKFIIETFATSDNQCSRKLNTPKGLISELSRYPLWRVAIIDLAGHFAIAVVSEGNLFLFNTTDFNYLEGTGALTVAISFDFLSSARSN